MHERPEDFLSGSLHNAEIQFGLKLSPGSECGRFESPALAIPNAADTAILSVNLRDASPEETGVAGFLCSAGGADYCSTWYRMFAWGLPLDPCGKHEGPDGMVHVDELRLTSPVGVWRYRLMWRTTRPGASIRRVALSLGAQSIREPVTDDAPNRKAWGCLIEIPFVSQWTARAHKPGRVCSPACVTMVARALGCNVRLDDVATATYDSDHDIYGNWALNMLAVSQYGLKAYVDRASSLRYLEDSIEDCLPVVASIAFGEGELESAPVPESNGHLVVVAGFSDDGDIIVRDPAARGADVHITYPRAQFERAWLGHGGVVYRIEPEPE